MIIRVFNIEWNHCSKYRPDLPKEVVWEVDGDTMQIMNQSVKSGGGWAMTVRIGENRAAELCMIGVSDWPTAARWIGNRLMADHRCAYDGFEYEWID